MQEKTITYQNYRDLNEAEENPWQYPTVAAVSPTGQIIVRHFTPGKNGEIGDVPIRSMDGTAVLSPRYARLGWCLYEDLCAGRVQGCEADRKAWERWETLIEINAGRIKRRIPKSKLLDNFWHPEVVRRRVDNGTPQLTDDELEELLPGLTVDRGVKE